MMRQSLLLQDTTYVYDEAGHHLGKYLGMGNKNPGEAVIYLDDTPVAMTIGGVLSYLETDHLGTPRVAANPATNALQWEWDFFGDAFGANAATSAPSGGIDVKLRYPGQYSDGESGLHYNYFRDYESGTGRYLESDPIGLEGGVGTFAYASGRPSSYIDPYGLAYGYPDCDIAVETPHWDHPGYNGYAGSERKKTCVPKPRPPAQPPTACPSPDCDYQCELVRFNNTQTPRVVGIGMVVIGAAVGIGAPSLPLKICGAALTLAGAGVELNSLNQDRAEINCKRKCHECGP